MSNFPARLEVVVGNTKVVELVGPYNYVRWTHERWCNRRWSHGKHFGGATIKALHAARTWNVPVGGKV